MIKNAMRVIWTMPLLLSLSGCAIGYDTTLFATKTNVGLDLDTKPPTLQLDIARREGVIAPSFEGGQTPPVMASFRLDDKPSLPFAAENSFTFEGGDAAATMATLFDDSTVAPPSKIVDSTLPLTTKPSVHKKLFGFIPLPTFEPKRAGSIQPFLFVTDTTMGLKVSWDGTTGEFPDSIRLAMQRKEFALAPVFGSDTPNVITDKNSGITVTNTYAVKMPSFLATLDTSVALASMTGSNGANKVTWLQYFASGSAADALALSPSIRQTMKARIDPLASKLIEKEEAARTEQRQAVDQIRSLFNKANPATQANMVVVAQALGLVNVDTTTTTFVNDIHGQEGKNSYTQKLDILENYAIKH